MPTPKKVKQQSSAVRSGKAPAPKKKRLSSGRATSPAMIEARDRAGEAMKLRMTGMSFEDIAEALGYTSRQRAHEAVTEGIKRLTHEPAKDLVLLELARLDAMFGKVFEAACAGNPKAVDACTKIMTRRSKMIGLDAPTQTKMDATVTAHSGVLVVPGAVDPEQWARDAAAQQASLTARDAAGDDAT